MIALVAAASAASVATDKTKALEDSNRQSDHGQVCGWIGQDFYSCTQGLFCNERSNPPICEWTSGGQGGRHGEPCNPNQWESCQRGLVCKFDAWRRGYYCDRDDGTGGGNPGGRGSPCYQDRDCQSYRCEFGRGGDRVGRCN